MPELIDSENVIAWLNAQIEKAQGGWLHDYGFPTNVIVALTDAKRFVKNLPTIEAEPVRHGRWKGWTTSKFTGRYKDYDEPEFKDYVYYTCSECYRKSAIQELYCPSCGARMDLRTPTELQLDEADDVMMGGADNC